LRPKLIWLKEPWQPGQTPKQKTPKPPPEPPGPLQPWDARRLREEQQAEEEKRQQRIKKFADEAAEKVRKANADPYPATVYYEGGGRVNHRVTSELREAWAKRHPDAKK
jgi:hypothetical protein